MGPHNGRVPVKPYPPAVWEGWRMEFFRLPVEFTYAASYAVCLCRSSGGFLLVDIPGRGWVTPSGKVEPGETSAQAASRESREEAGAILDNLEHCGVYRIASDGKIRFADVFVADVMSLSGVSEGEVKVVGLDQLAEIYVGWNPLFERVFTEFQSDRSRE